MTFEIDGQKRDRIAGQRVPLATADDAWGRRHPFILATDPLSAMSYACVPLAMVTSAIRRAAVRRLEVRALERALARAGQEAERPRSGRRPAFFIQSRRPARPRVGE